MSSTLILDALRSSLCYTTSHVSSPIRYNRVHLLYFPCNAKNCEIPEYQSVLALNKQCFPLHRLTMSYALPCALSWNRYRVQTVKEAEEDKLSDLDKCKYSSCFECTLDSRCGWCHFAGKCFEGDDRGPYSATCSTTWHRVRRLHYTLLSLSVCVYLSV